MPVKRGDGRMANCSSSPVRAKRREKNEVEISVSVTASLFFFIDKRVKVMHFI